MIVAEDNSEYVIDAYDYSKIGIWEKHGRDNQRWIMPDIK